MLKARSLPDRPIVCPSCENPTYSVYRREPAGSGGVRNNCRCERCDETFAYDEDKVGCIVPPPLA